MNRPDIISHPTSALTYLAPEGGIYPEEYRNDRRKRIRALGSPLTRVICYLGDTNILEIFPEWLADAGPGVLRHGRMRDRMLKNPVFGVQMLVRAYDETSPLLERSVLASGEATAKLLAAIDAGSVKPSEKREHYEGALLAEPWWALSYLETPSPNLLVAARRAKFAVKLKKESAERAQSSAQAALVHLYLNPKLDPQAFAETLCGEPMVAYLASRLLGDRGLELKLEQVWNLDARWATHIALWGKFTGVCNIKRIEAAIATHPAWTAEYIARSSSRRQGNWDWIKGMYECVETAFGKGSHEDEYLWADLLWAMLDRMCLRIEGKDPRITLGQSFARHQPTEATESVAVAAT